MFVAARIISRVVFGRITGCGGFKIFVCERTYNQYWDNILQEQRIVDRETIILLTFSSQTWVCFLKSNMALPLERLCVSLDLWMKWVLGTLRRHQQWNGNDGFPFNVNPLLIFFFFSIILFTSLGTMETFGPSIWIRQPPPFNTTMLSLEMWRDESK